MNIDTAEKWMHIVNNMLNENPIVRCESYRLIREGITGGLQIFDPFTEYLAHCVSREYETHLQTLLKLISLYIDSHYGFIVDEYYRFYYVFKAVLCKYHQHWEDCLNNIFLNKIFIKILETFPPRYLLTLTIRFFAEPKPIPIKSAYRGLYVSVSAAAVTGEVVPLITPFTPFDVLRKACIALIDIRNAYKSYPDSDVYQWAEDFLVALWYLNRDEMMMVCHTLDRNTQIEVALMVKNYGKNKYGELSLETRKTKRIFDTMEIPDKKEDAQTICKECLSSNSANYASPPPSIDLSSMNIEEIHHDEPKYDYKFKNVIDGLPNPKHDDTCLPLLEFNESPKKPIHYMEWRAELLKRKKEEALALGIQEQDDSSDESDTQQLRSTRAPFIQTKAEIHQFSGSEVPDRGAKTEIHRFCTVVETKAEIHQPSGTGNVSAREAKIKVYQFGSKEVTAKETETDDDELPSAEAVQQFSSTRLTARESILNLLKKPETTQTTEKDLSSMMESNYNLSDLSKTTPKPHEPLEVRMSFEFSPMSLQAQTIDVCDTNEVQCLPSSTTESEYSKIDDELSTIHEISEENVLREKCLLKLVSEINEEPSDNQGQLENQDDITEDINNTICFKGIGVDCLNAIKDQVTGEKTAEDVNETDDRKYQGIQSKKSKPYNIQDFPEDLDELDYESTLSENSIDDRELLREEENMGGIEYYISETELFQEAEFSEELQEVKEYNAAQFEGKDKYEKEVQGERSHRKQKEQQEKSRKRQKRKVNSDIDFVSSPSDVRTVWEQPSGPALTYDVSQSGAGSSRGFKSLLTIPSKLTSLFRGKGFTSQSTVVDEKIGLHPAAVTARKIKKYNHAYKKAKIELEVVNDEIYNCQVQLNMIEYEIDQLRNKIRFHKKRIRDKERRLKEKYGLADI